MTGHPHVSSLEKPETPRGPISFTWRASMGPAKLLTVSWLCSHSVAPTEVIHQFRSRPGKAGLVKSRPRGFTTRMSPAPAKQPTVPRLRLHSAVPATVPRWVLSWPERPGFAQAGGVIPE
ncbi:hypothetical protein NDU88_006473 [Pleurodeles waltl]|uniref:Uncharacterized protein n=1 Tax=Pleurodeles waltl TaxID=8319 RepID=A0AAV7WXP3_PLEWA|nr:hypothetical protein NDU88_006473 [Pleurodeles waltl]